MKPQPEKNSVSRRGFICAGCWTIDRVKLIDQWPNEEQLALITAVDRQGGGSAYNVGIDLRKLDSSMPVATIAMLGDDSDGEFLWQQANQYQIDTAQLRRTSESATSYTDVMSVIDSGKRTFFHHTGSNDLLKPEHFNFSGSTARILHLGLLSLHAQMDAAAPDGSNGWSTVLKAAQSHGLKTSIELVSINPVRNRELVQPCLPYIDYLIINDHEIGSLADIDTLSDQHLQKERCLQAARKVLSMGSMQFVAVHFPQGAVCVTRSGDEFEAPSLQVPQSQIMGSVGAGDAFVAGFLYAIHESWSIPNALALAHTVAAVSLRSATTVEAVESVENCRAIAQQWLRT